MMCVRKSLFALFSIALASLLCSCLEENGVGAPEEEKEQCEAVTVYDTLHRTWGYSWEIPLQSGETKRELLPRKGGEEFDFEQYPFRIARLFPGFILSPYDGGPGSPVVLYDGATEPCTTHVRVELFDTLALDSLIPPDYDFAYSAFEKAAIDDALSRIMKGSSGFVNVVSPDRFRILDIPDSFVVTAPRLTSWCCDSYYSRLPEQRASGCPPVEVDTGTVVLCECAFLTSDGPFPVMYDEKTVIGLEWNLPEDLDSLVVKWETENAYGYKDTVESRVQLAPAVCLPEPERVIALDG